jgi:hypothetical protein
LAYQSIRASQKDSYRRGENLAGNVPIILDNKIASHET